MNDTLLIKKKLLLLNQPIVMAIINATPDSFYTHTQAADELLECVNNAIAEGATIVDVGGCSTRPDSTPATEQEELSRISAALDIIRKHYPEVPISIDTYRASVAYKAIIDYDCDIINDISAFSIDDSFLQTIAELQRPYILSHYPTENIPSKTSDDKFLAEVLKFFAERINMLRDAGFNGDIIIDPGFGFKKSVRQNHLLLHNLHLLKTFNCPILAGLSHKSMFYQPLGLSPEKVLPATIAANTIAIQQGASILRVHEVAPAIQTIKTVNYFKQQIL